MSSVIRKQSTNAVGPTGEDQKGRGRTATVSSTLPIKRHSPANREAVSLRGWRQTWPRLGKTIAIIAAVGAVMGGLVGYWNAYQTVKTSVAVGTSVTQVAPIDIKASPEVYKEIAGNDQYRMVETVWKPGQRDQFHSHPRMLFYWMTDCSLRMYLPDGTTQHIDIKAGHAGIQDTISSHSVENRGPSECRIVMFEPRLSADQPATRRELCQRLE
jgi:quercetin dioxygenase-like cupin family protein